MKQLSKSTFTICHIDYFRIQIDYYSILLITKLFPLSYANAESQ